MPAPHVVVDPYVINLIVADGGVPIGVATGLGQDYPFAGPAPEAAGIVANVQLETDTTLFNAPEPLRVAWLYGLNLAFGDPSSGGTIPSGYTPIHDAEILIVSGSIVVFDSTQAYYYAGRVLSPRLRSHEWRSETMICRVIQHTGFRTAADVVPVPQSIAPADGRLAARCWRPWPRRLLQANLFGGGTIGPGTSLRLVLGSNMTATIAPVAGRVRPTTKVTLAAQAGGGIGRNPGCPGTAAAIPVRTINGQHGDAAGDFQLTAQGCYYVRQPTALTRLLPSRLSQPVASTLKVGNDCRPCCRCSDFVAVQNGLLASWARWVDIAARASGARDAYHANRARWQADQACRAARPVSLNLIGHETIFVEVGAAFVNHTPQCLRHVSLDVTLATAPPTGSFVGQDTTYITDGKGGLLPYVLTPIAGGYQAYWREVAPQSSAAVRFRLVLQLAPVVVTVTAAATVDGVAQPGAVVKSVTLP